MEPRTIPFTASQRKTIRTTGLLMVPVGLLLAVAGGKALLKTLPVLMVIRPWPFVVSALGDAIMVALGLALVIGGAAFLRVAREGTVPALVRGLRALCAVFMIKAALLLAMAALMLLAMLGGPFLQ